MRTGDFQKIMKKSSKKVWKERKSAYLCSPFRRGGMKEVQERMEKGIQEKIIDKAERQSKYNKVPRTINESVNSKTGIHSPDRLERNRNIQ